MKWLAIFTLFGIFSSINGLGQAPSRVAQSLKFAKKAAKQFDNGKFGASIANYTRAIDFYPEHEFNYYYRGLAYKANDEKQLAFKDFDRAILFNSESRESYYERGLLHLEFGRYKKALYDIENHIAINSETPALLLKKAEILIHLADYPAAIADLNKYILGVSNPSTGHLKRAFCLIQMKQLVPAYTELTKGIELNDTSDERYYVEGVYYLATKEGQKATEAFKRIINSSDSTIENARNYHLISNAYAQLNDYDNAIKTATKAISIDPLANYYYDRGNYYTETAELNKANADFTATIKKDSTHIGAYNNRTFFVWFPQKKYHNAVADLTKIIEIDSVNAHALCNRSYAYLGLDKIELAFLDAFKSADLDHMNPYIYKNLALLYHAVDEDGEAKNAARGALHWGFPVDSDPEFKALLIELEPLE